MNDEGIGRYQYDYAKLEARYIAGDMSLRDLAKEVGMSNSTISAHARDHSWKEKRAHHRSPAAVHIREPLRYEDVTKLLRERYAPPQWAYIEQVGDATGSYTSRHADGLAMGLWPSRGLELLGFEVKVSRSDWRRELLKPDKAEPIARRCDRWFVVAPAEVVPLLEVPANWGLIEVRNGKLIQTKEAAKLDPLPLDQSFLAAILRRASTQNPTEQMRLDARHEAREEMLAELPHQVEYKTASLRGELNGLRSRVEAFEAATGIPLEDHKGTGYFGFPSGEDLARAVLFLAGGGIKKIRWQIDTIDRVIEHLQGATNVAKELIEEPGELGP